MPIEFYYIECTKEEDPYDEAFRILKQNYCVNYCARNKKGIVYLSPLGELEPIQLHEGQEVKNVMFPSVYDGKGDFMDLDCPNSFMDGTIGLHQIEIIDRDGSGALCSVSNKRLIALLATNKHGNDGYEKASPYGIYVLYDINVERVIEQQPLS